MNKSPWNRVSAALDRFLTAWQHVVKRSVAHWRLLLSVMVGVVLASTVMAGTVLFYDALRELALKQTLAKHTPAELDVVARTELSPTTGEQYRALTFTLDSVVGVTVDWLLRGKSNGGHSATFFLATPGQEDRAGEESKRTYFAFATELEEHIELLPGGRLPGPRRPSPPGEVPEVQAIVPQDAAELFGVGVGDKLVAVPWWEDLVTQVDVEITGVFRRLQPSDEEFWHFEETALRAPTGASFQTIPFLISERTFTEVLGPSLPKMKASYSWLLKTDADRLDAWNAENALANVHSMNTALGTTWSSYSAKTALDNALQEYDRRLFFNKLPMFVVLVLITIVVLYYVTTLSSIVIEDRRTEVALLRGRGADAPQLLSVFALEGATIAGLSIALSPLIAAASVAALGLTPVFSDLTGGASLNVQITVGAYMLSALGGGLSFVALMIPAVQASRMEVTRQRQHAARPPRLPAFQRYYIDVLLLLVGVFLFRQLTEQGSLVAVDLFGESTTDRLLLAVPGLILVASSMVLLRLFPLGMNVASKLLANRLPAGPVMGLWQMARDPVHYARLSLLLILTAGLGIFASSFEATLDRSFDERVLYSTGSDIRLEFVSPTGEVIGADGSDSRLRLVNAYEAVPGVRGAAPVMRTEGADLESAEGGRFEMLAVDVETFPRVAWFREDFADRPIGELLRSLKVEGTPQGVELPADSSALRVRLKPDKFQPTVRLTARIRNAVDQHHNFPLGALDSTDWFVLETSLSSASPDLFAASPPYTLVSIQLHETVLERTLLQGSVFFDEISVANEAGESTVVEGFDDASGWRILQNTEEAVADGLGSVGEVFDAGSGSVLFHWGSGSTKVPRGIFRGQDRPPLPVLAGKAFVKSTGRKVGDEFDSIVAGSPMPVRIVGEVELFPTITGPDRHFLVSDFTALGRYANLGKVGPQLLSLNMWISTEQHGPERQGLAESLKSVSAYRSVFVQDSAGRLESSRVDPLVGAGWRALLFLSFAAVLILSAVGFLIHAYLSFRNREFQFALQRTMGLSTNQLLTMVWVEQALVIVLGLALGTFMGSRLGATIMPFLGHDDWGLQVVPPFAMEANWGALLMTYAAMVTVFGIITFGMVWFIRRIAVHRILRLGER